MTKKKTKTLRSNDFNFDLFEKAIEEAGYTKRGLSVLIGGSKNYLSVCFSPSRKYIPELQAKLICAVIQRDLDEFLIDKKEVEQPTILSPEVYSNVYRDTLLDRVNRITIAVERIAEELCGAITEEREDLLI